MYVTARINLRFECYLAYSGIVLVLSLVTNRTQSCHEMEHTFMTCSSFKKIVYIISSHVGSS